MSKKDGRYEDYVQIVEDEPKNIVELVLPCIEELMESLIKQAKKDKNVPDMTTLHITVKDWFRMNEILDKVHTEEDFKDALMIRKIFPGVRYTVGVRFESLKKEDKNNG